MLCIMDGFGLAPAGPGNAIAAAKTPNLDRLFAEKPHTQLQASGRAVGLPAGQMGNSEVGHTNMGAGRVVWQELSHISNEIEEGGFFENEALLSAAAHVRETGGSLHIYGLMSDGGVHSHIEHIEALAKLAADGGVPFYVHCFMDGRDTSPTSGEGYVSRLEQRLSELGSGRVGVVTGRYYAMDRDKRWDRVELAYRAMTEPSGKRFASGTEAVKDAYAAGETDEFIKPRVCEGFGGIKSGDSVIFANFRPDRAREITRAFVDPEFDGFARRQLADLCYVCMTQYDATIPGVLIAYPPQELKNTFGEYVSSLGMTQLRIAETEKYAHVTFFFNGGREKPFEGEDRILVPSPKVATYDLKPEMSAYEVKDKLVEAIKTEQYDFIVVNFANGDMVGHTGVYNAIAKAVWAVDNCVREVIEAAKAADYEALIIADHGNADNAINEDGTPNTAHSLNPVPIVYVTNNNSACIKNGRLADVAPTILHIMGLEQPADMTGECLIY